MFYVSNCYIISYFNQGSAIHYLTTWLSPQSTNASKNKRKSSSLLLPVLLGPEAPSTGSSSQLYPTKSALYNRKKHHIVTCATYPVYPGNELPTSLGNLQKLLLPNERTVRLPNKNKSVCNSICFACRGLIRHLWMWVFNSVLLLVSFWQLRRNIKWFLRCKLEFYCFKSKSCFGGGWGMKLKEFINLFWF